MILIIMFLYIITYIYEINNYIVDKNIKILWLSQVELDFIFVI